MPVLQRAEGNTNPRRTTSALPFSVQGARSAKAVAGEGRSWRQGGTSGNLDWSAEAEGVGQPYPSRDAAECRDLILRAVPATNPAARLHTAVKSLPKVQDCADWCRTAFAAKPVEG